VACWRRLGQRQGHGPRQLWFFQSLTNKASKVFGGGQRGRIVFGVEADLGAVNVSHSATERITASMEDNLHAGPRNSMAGRLAAASNTQTPAWSIEAEYPHFYLDTEDSVIVGCCKDGGLFPFDFEHDLTAGTVKAGVNYRISPGYSPLK
jgi:hypothetical protein